MKRKSMLAVIFLCIGILALPLSGCKKKDDESTAIAITPTPSDKSKDDASETPAPTISANANAEISANGTGTPGLAAGIPGNTGISANAAGNANKITGAIVAASMNDVTVRTSEGAEYVCSTTSAANNLSNGITLGNNITVTLASMSAVNGVYTATELNDISSSQGGASNIAGSSGTGAGIASDGTDTGIADDSDTYIYDETYDDSYSDYSEDYIYDDGSSDYYYDPADEIYDESYYY